jgi:hypothetical protein
MSTPRDRDGFGDRPDDGGTWREPEHLGGDGNDAGDGGDGNDAGDGGDGRNRSAQPDLPGKTPAPWQPPGWDLPPATPGSTPAGTPVPPATGPDRTPDLSPSDLPPSGPADGRLPRPPVAEPRSGGLFGRRRAAPPGEVEKVFSYEGDLVGAQGWALQQGWTISDGSAPEDAVLRDLVASAPVRATKDHVPASVLRGRAGNLELVAFDVVYSSGRYVVPEFAVTAAPLLAAVPGFRLSPARFWKHRIGGLLPIASGNEHFDSRWLLLAAEDSPQVRHLVGDATVQGLLLGTDDGDEFWSAAGHVAAIRPDGHRPQLLEHHARLLTAIVGALNLGF